MGISQTPQAIVPASLSTISNWSLLNAGGTALTGADTITISGLSGKSKLMILVRSASGSSTGSDIGVRINTTTSGSYYYAGNFGFGGASYSTSVINTLDESNVTFFNLGRMGSNAASVVSGYCLIHDTNSTGLKMVQVSGGGDPGGGNSHRLVNYGGWFDSTSAITSISIYNSNANFDAGTVFVYGA